MSTLFIIGNGFDLNCGAKTSYQDVYKEYIKEPSEDPVIKSFKKSIITESDKWSDFEIGMGQYAKELENEVDFINCARDFSTFLSNYLNNVNKEFEQKINKLSLPGIVMNEVSNLLKNFYRDITNNITYKMEERDASNFNNIDVISFNYTNLFELMVKGLVQITNNNKPIIHVHGSIEEKIVMGVDSASYINSKFPITIDGERCFVKPVLNESFDQRRIDMADKKIEDADVICVFGAALGDSDLRWRNKIIEWLNSSKDNYLFVFVHESISPKELPLDEQIQIEQKERKDLFERWEIQEKCFDQVRIQCNKDIIDIKSAIDNYYKNERKIKKEREKENKKLKQLVEQRIAENKKRPIENGIGGKPLGV